MPNTPCILDFIGRKMESWQLNRGFSRCLLENVPGTSADLSFVRTNPLVKSNFKSERKYNLTMHMEDGEPEIYLNNTND